MSRTFYAIVYAYGRSVVNNGNRADHVHQFATVGERTAFIDSMERDGHEADPILATNPTVKKALRYAAQSQEWPIAV